MRPIDKSKIRVLQRGDAIALPASGIEKESPENFLYLLLEQDVIGKCRIGSKAGGKSHRATYSVNSDHLNNEFIHLLLMKSIIANISRNRASDLKTVAITPDYSDQKIFSFITSKIKDITHSKNGNQITYSISNPVLWEVGALKNKLEMAADFFPKVGAGYLVDLTPFPSEVIQALQNEYNSIAWGGTNLARHSEIAADEGAIIDRFCKSDNKVLEIGAGSGRLTRRIAAAAGNVTAVDYLPEIITTLSNNVSDIKNIETALLDITAPITNQSTLFGSFDKCLFLENGLGSMLDPKIRTEAILNMFHSIKSNGQLILGLRTMGDISLDQLMIASQNRDFMGIYHLFCPNEIRASVTKIKKRLNIEIQEVECIPGDIRPAGGRQFFMVFQKK